VANVTPVAFYCFKADRWNGIHNLATDSIKVLLTNTAPSLSNTVASNITQIAAGGGYSTGGFAVTTISSTQTAGVYKWLVTDYTLTASAAIATWRYAAFYNFTSTTDALMFYFDYGSAISMTTGDTFVFDFNGTNGVIYEP
jgi:hypothetical protein